jgi:hypothetical protein
LLQAAKGIFMPQQTGFLSNGGEQGSPQILEILRAVGKETKD